MLCLSEAVTETLFSSFGKLESVNSSQVEHNSDDELYDEQGTQSMSLNVSGSVGVQVW